MDENHGIGAEDDAIQRALNDAKRAELSERFDAVSFGRNSSVDAGTEADFLASVEAYELAMMNATETTVRAYIGNPELPDLAGLSEEEIEAELDRIFTLFEENEISLATIEDVEPAELYRFILEEFLDEMVNDVRVPGMRQCFIYEEYHPNPLIDIKSYSESFMVRLFLETKATDFREFEAIVVRHGDENESSDPIDTEALREELTLVPGVGSEVPFFVSTSEYHSQEGELLVGEELEKRFVAISSRLRKGEIAECDCDVISYDERRATTLVVVRFEDGREERATIELALDDLGWTIVGSSLL